MTFSQSEAVPVSGLQGRPAFWLEQLVTWYWGQGCEGRAGRSLEKLSSSSLVRVPLQPPPGPSSALLDTPGCTALRKEQALRGWQRAGPGNLGLKRHLFLLRTPRLFLLGSDTFTGGICVPAAVLSGPPGNQTLRGPPGPLAPRPSRIAPACALSVLWLQRPAEEHAAE